MLNKKACVAALLATSFAASPAFAACTKNKIFLGLDIQAVFLNLDNNLERWTMDGSTSFIRNNLAGLSVFGGYRWDQAAFEIGITGMTKVTYTGTAKSGTTTILNANLDQKNYNAYVDALLFYPINSNLELKGLIGLGVLTTKFDGNITITDSGYISTTDGTSTESSAGLRLGAGAQYNFNDHWGSSLMYKYQWGNDYFSSMQAIALAVAYYF